jgi:hypothetical protein
MSTIPKRFENACFIRIDRPEYLERLRSAEGKARGSGHESMTDVHFTAQHSGISKDDGYYRCENSLKRYTMHESTFFFEKRLEKYRCARLSILQCERFLMDSLRKPMEALMEKMH